MTTAANRSTTTRFARRPRLGAQRSALSIRAIDRHPALFTVLEALGANIGPSRLARKR